MRYSYRTFFRLNRAKTKKIQKQAENSNDFGNKSDDDDEK